MVQLIIYAVVAAGAAFAAYQAWTGFKEHVAAPYVQAQMAADQKVVTRANDAQAAAEGERDHAKEDTKACVALSDKQTKALEESDRRAKSAIADAKALRVKQMKEVTAQAPYIADLQAKAAAAPLVGKKLQSCEVEMAKARPILQTQLRQKRGIPEPDAPVAVPVAAPAVEPPPALVK